MATTLSTAKDISATVLALVNNKGGVGKTTSAVNIAAGIAARGFKVLLVDMDAQGSASLSLGLTRADLRPGTADVLLDAYPARKGIRKSLSTQPLDILPGSMDLASADILLAGVMGREEVLKASIQSLLKDYDYIVLDCPPSMGLLTVNAVIAADYYLVPVTPDYLALEGLVNLLEAVKKIRAGIGGAAELMGILLTLADYRLNATREIGELIRAHYGKIVFKTEIRGNVKLKEAPSFGKTIFDYDDRSSGAEAYRGVVKEVLRRATVKSGDR